MSGKNSNVITKLLIFFSISLPFFIAFIVLYPVLNHYYFVLKDIDNNAISNIKTSPPDIVLNRLISKRVMLPARKSKSIAIKQADSILNGRLIIKNNITIPINPMFSPDDLDIGSPATKLEIASLTVPATLLDAYYYTNNEKYFNTASNYILSWSEYENNRFLPRGFLWDDHAISARIHVYIMFWQLYRKHNSFDVNNAKNLLKTIYLNARMLASSEHFTYATNHGVMQNLALWKIAIAFPRLPGNKKYIEVAHERLTNQLKYYVSDEGVVLEHSAQYQTFGVKLLGLMIDYMSMLYLTPDESLIMKYENAKQVYGNLRRPDNTIPMYGDTQNKIKETQFVSYYDKSQNRYSSLEKKENWMPDSPVSIYKQSGLAIWWDGLKNWPDKKQLAQTTITWANFESGAHKHADELSVLFWAHGYTWWSNVGYWPYGDKFRKKAISWNGSNAPFCTGEEYDSKRYSKLISEYNDKTIKILDLQRTSEAGCTLRRQIIQLSSNEFEKPIWLVIDNVTGERSMQQIWTVPPNINIEKHKDAYTLNVSDTKNKLAVQVKTAPGSHHDIIKGSLQPFAGWISMDRDNDIEITNSIHIQVPKDGWSAILWKMGDEQENNLSFTVDYWYGPEKWKIAIVQNKNRSVVLSRDGLTFSTERVTSPANNRSLVLEKSNRTAEYTKYDKAYRGIAEKYPKYIDVSEYRLKFIKIIFAIVLVQEIIFFLLRRISKNILFYQLLRVASLVCWVLVGFWQELYYFAI